MSNCLIILTLICTNMCINQKKGDIMTKESVIIKRTKLFGNKKVSKLKGYVTLPTPWIKIEKTN